MRGWAPCRWKVGVWNVSVCNFSPKQPFVGLKDLLTAAENIFLLINQTANQLFLSFLFLFFHRAAVWEKERIACMQWRVNAGLCSWRMAVILYFPGWQTRMDGSVFRIESRILGFTTKTLHPEQPWKCSLHFFLPPLRTREMKATEEDTKEFPPASGI